ncbi:hypothetical protein QQG74_00160 [Micromonospora sp. FIMYZ51]|uniref:hypothetical protein n=1 Tax=Micromonospora sp. FIMYZ51 TaxID=3051832 RepID=UPI00311FA0C6
MDEVEALVRLARSADFSDRAHAGIELSRFAGTVDEVLLELLLDDENGYPVQMTAEALIKRGDAAALRPFAAAWHRAGAADDSQILDHLYGATSYGRWLDATDSRRTGLQAVLATLLDDRDEAVRKGAESLIAAFSSHS